MRLLVQAIELIWDSISYPRLYFRKVLPGVSGRMKQWTVLFSRRFPPPFQKAAAVAVTVFDSGLLGVRIVGESLLFYGLMVDTTALNVQCISSK